MRRADADLTTVISYPERGTGGNSRYRGNCAPQVIEDLIHFYKPAEICDYMVGSGTTFDAAAVCGMRFHFPDEFHLCEDGRLQVFKKELRKEKPQQENNNMEE